MTFPTEDSREVVEYTKEQAVKNLSVIVAQVTSGLEGAIPEDEDRELAEELIDFINASIFRRKN